MTIEEAKARSEAYKQAIGGNAPAIKKLVGILQFLFPPGMNLTVIARDPSIPEGMGVGVACITAETDILTVVRALQNADEIMKATAAAESVAPQEGFAA